MELSLCDLEYNKDKKVLYLRLHHGYPLYPKELRIMSHITGRTVRFEQDRKAAENNDFWDGELMEYPPVTDIPNVKKIIAWYE